MDFIKQPQQTGISHCITCFLSLGHNALCISIYDILCVWERVFFLRLFVCLFVQTILKYIEYSVIMSFVCAHKRCWCIISDTSAKHNTIIYKNFFQLNCRYWTGFSFSFCLSSVFVSECAKHLNAECCRLPNEHKKHCRKNPLYISSSYLNVCVCVVFTCFRFGCVLVKLHLVWFYGVHCTFSYEWFPQMQMQIGVSFF